MRKCPCGNIATGKDPASWVCEECKRKDSVTKYGRFSETLIIPRQIDNEVYGRLSSEFKLRDYNP
jgi:hypothetical protein